MSRVSSGGTGRTALTAVLAALSLALLYLAAAAPSGRLGLTALAGLVPAAAVVSCGGPRSGLLCCAAAGVLGLLLSPNKSCAVLYLLFFGPYSVVKSLAERLRSRWAGLFCKLGFFNLALTVLWFGLRGLIAPMLPGALDRSWLVYLAGNLVFVLYDAGFSQVIAFYIARIDRNLRK
ncbi:MAG: hypothetical protein MR648_10720 [Clostridiales bacterium]|nr:hypothetical protein [Clostridiales bacterium]